jgi:hypothetical protein
MGPLLSKHLDLVAGVGIEQAVIGGTLGLARLQRRIGADGEPVAGSDRHNPINKRLLTERRLLGRKPVLGGERGAHAARAKVHSLSRTKAKRKSAALLAWDAALKMARLSARNTASNREVVVM